MDLSPSSLIRGSLHESKETAQRAADLMNQRLACSGKGKFIVKALNLNELVEDMGHPLRVSISKKGVLKYDLADHLPAVEGDVAQLRQIVMNLITNASEATGRFAGKGLAGFIQRPFEVRQLLMTLRSALGED